MRADHGGLREERPQELLTANWREAGEQNKRYLLASTVFSDLFLDGPRC